MGWEDAPVVDKNAWESAPIVGAPPTPIPGPSADIADRIAGSTLGRGAIGVGMGLLGGPLQLGANIGDKIAKELGLDPVVGKAINEHIQRLSQMQRRGLEYATNKGETPIDIAGTVGRAAPYTGIATATSYLGRIAQGMGIGGLAGATSPVTSGEENVLPQMGINAAIGGAVGGAIPAVVPPITAVGSALKALTKSPQELSGNAYISAAGDKSPEVMALLQQNKQIVPGSLPTSGEAAVPAGSVEFSALQKSASKVPEATDAYLAREQAQNAARLAQVRSVGQTPAILQIAQNLRAENAAKNYGQITSDLINPQSDVQIMEGAIAGRQAAKGEALRDWGRFATQAAEQENLAHGGSVQRTSAQILMGERGNVSPSAYPNAVLPGGQAPRVPGRYTENFLRVPETQSAAEEAANIATFRQKQIDYLKNAMDSLRNTVGLDSRSLNDFATRPSMKSAVQDALLSAQETGSYFPAAPGEKFSVGNLQRVKESLDQGIMAAAKAVDAGRRPELSPTELMGTRNDFVKWLSNKSPGWRDARLQYASESQPINQMQIGQYLENKLVPALSDEAKQKAGTYAQALQDAPGTIKRAVGGPRFESLTKVLNPEQLTAVNSVKTDLERGSLFENMARKGTTTATDVATEEMKKPLGGNIPAFLQRSLMVMHTILDRAAGNIDKRTAANIATEMLNPPKVAESMAEAMARQNRNKLISSAIEKMRLPTTAAASER